jgi:FlaG/FlaF family flagellin (archaellin)
MKYWQSGFIIFLHTLEKAPMLDTPPTADRATSPAIGLVVVIGLTVVVGGVLAAAVLQQQSEANVPSVRFTYDYYDGCGTADAGESLRIRHGGGEQVDTNNLFVRYEDVQATEQGEVTPSSGLLQMGTEENYTTLSSGDWFVLGPSPSDLQFEDATVHVMWQGDGQRYSLSTWHGDDAGRPAEEGPCLANTNSTGSGSDPSIAQDCAVSDSDKGHGNDCNNIDEDNPGNGGPA